MPFFKAGCHVSVSRRIFVNAKFEIWNNCSGISVHQASRTQQFVIVGGESFCATPAIAERLVEKILDKRREYVCIDEMSKTNLRSPSCSKEQKSSPWSTRIAFGTSFSA